MKKLLLPIIATSVLAACSNGSGSYDSKNALERWDRYHEDSIHSTNLKDNQALAVFYRTDNLDGEGINVYVNGDYQASVLAHSYSPVAVCANKPLFSASRVTNKQFGNRTDGLRHELEEGKTYFFKLVQDNKGQLTFESVPTEQAKAELGGMKGEIRHTLPRVVTGNACDTVGEEKTLSAHALWGLNKHSYADMLDEGKKEIAEFAQYLKENSNITRIQISGFTDPEASDNYNLVLSQRRADTVRKALLQAGVKQQISAKGYGETQLVVSDCAAKHTDRKARSVCNLPNRRVEITTYVK